MSVDTAGRLGPTPGGAPVDERGESQTLSGYARIWWQGVRAGELGSLPIVVGLILIFITFGILEENFFTERNFTNLLLQMAAVATMAIGIV
ncbi:MAG: sugar ABC transporter permease, partial [Gaiellaceae bacterium]